MFVCLFVGTAPSDNAYAAFSLLNMIIYFVWAIILAVHRNTVILDQNNAGAKDEFAGQTDGGEVYNPVGATNTNYDHDFDGAGDEVAL